MALKLQAVTHMVSAVLLAACVVTSSDVPNVLWTDRPDPKPYFITLEALNSPAIEREVPNELLASARETLRKKVEERRGDREERCDRPIIGDAIGGGRALTLLERVTKATTFAGRIDEIKPGFDLYGRYVAALLVVSVIDEINDPRSEIWTGARFGIFWKEARAVVDGVRLCTAFGGSGYSPRVGDEILVLGSRDLNALNAGHFYGSIHPISDDVVEVQERFTNHEPKRLPIDAIRRAGRKPE